MYGHLNNVVYYEYLDTAVNAWLVNEAGLSVPSGDVVGLVVESGCVFHASLGWPQPIDVGLRIGRIGRTSILYEAGLFEPGTEEAAADLHFTHVYVDTQTRRPVELPKALRDAATSILKTDCA